MMNRILFSNHSQNHISQNRSRSERSVNRHLLMRQLQNQVAMGILGATVLLIVFGMLLLILPAFKVHSITVQGNHRIAKESVIAASGVSEGDELLNLNKSEIADRIAQDENIERVSVSTSLGAVTIRIVEKENVAIVNTADASVR